MEDTLLFKTNYITFQYLSGILFENKIEKYTRLDKNYTEQVETDFCITINHLQFLVHIFAYMKNGLIKYVNHLGFQSNTDTKDLNKQVLAQFLTNKTLIWRPYGQFI